MQKQLAAHKKILNKIKDGNQKIKKMKDILCVQRRLNDIKRDKLQFTKEERVLLNQFMFGYVIVLLCEWWFGIGRLMEGVFVLGGCGGCSWILIGICSCVCVCVCMCMCVC